MVALMLCNNTGSVKAGICMYIVLYMCPAQDNVYTWGGYGEHAQGCTQSGTQVGVSV